MTMLRRFPCFTACALAWCVATATAQTVPAPVKPPAGARPVAPGNLGAGGANAATPPPPSTPAPAGLPSPSPYPSGLPSPLPFPAGVPSDVIAPPGTGPAGAAGSSATGNVGAIVLPPAPGTAVPLPRPTPLEILQSFQRADLDRDGVLSRAEAQRLTVAPTQRSFEDLDRNKDGGLSRPEYEEGLR